MPSLLARRLVLPALALGLAALPACDVTTDLDAFQLILQVDELPVSLGQGVSASIRPDRPSATTASVPTDFDVEEVQDLESITLRPEMFSFTRGAGARAARGGGSASGTIAGYVFIGGVPVPGMPVVITIVDDAVTAISPATLADAAATLDADAIEAFIASLPEAERPVLSDWRALSTADLRERIRAAMEGEALDITFGLTAESTDPSDPLVGTLTLSEIDISAIITR